MVASPNVEGLSPLRPKRWLRLARLIFVTWSALTLLMVPQSNEAFAQVKLDPKQVPDKGKVPLPKKELPPKALPPKPGVQLEPKQIPDKGAVPQPRIPPRVVPAPSITQQLPPTPAFNYIVAVLDSVKIHDDEDNLDEGEIFIIAGGGTGEPGARPNTHTTHFPIKLWREANSGNTFPVKVPLFVAREDQMRDELLLAVAAADVDDGPAWIDRAIETSATVAATALGTELAGPAGGTAGGAAGGAVASALTGVMRSQDVIGAFDRRHSRSFDNWGLRRSGGDIPDPCSRYTVRADELTANYSVCRVHMLPVSVRIFVQLGPVTVHDGGDSGGGQVFFRTRVSDGINRPQIMRFPEGGSTQAIRNGRDWAGGELIYNGGRTQNPVLFVEVDGWDSDAPRAGDDHDMLGIASWMLGLRNMRDRTGRVGLPTRSGERREYPLSMRVRGIDEGDITVRVTVIVQKE